MYKLSNLCSMSLSADKLHVYSLKFITKNHRLSCNTDVPGRQKMYVEWMKRKETVNKRHTFSKISLFHGGQKAVTRRAMISPLVLRLALADPRCIVAGPLTLILQQATFLACRHIRTV